MLSFEIHPYVGALPIAFGMARAEVHAILGRPDTSGAVWEKSGICDAWFAPEMNVGYDRSGVVNHVGFGHGRVSLRSLGSVIWSDEVQPDPNPILRHLDLNPMERVGFLCFTQLGVTTTGYHDDDESQRAITVYPRGSTDEFLKKAKVPDLSRYNETSDKPISRSRDRDLTSRISRSEVDS